MADVEVITTYDSDESIEETRTLILTVIHGIEKDYRKSVQPWLDRLAELEAYRTPRYLLVPKD